MSGTRSPWLVLAVLCLGQSVALMDTTVVNVAVPTMTGDLGASLPQILWVINGYVLSYAVLLVVGGRLGDLFGQRRMFAIGLSVFVCASAACGAAGTAWMIIAARVVQGVGAAMLTPQALAVLAKIFPPERRGAALGLWGMYASAAAAVGPTLGGLIVSAWGWRWVFFINVPIGVSAIVLGLLVVPGLPRKQARRLDVLGTVLLTAALFLLVFAFIEGPSHDWGQVLGPVTAVELGGAAVLLLGVFFAVERHRQQRDPLVPFAVLRDYNFRLMAFAVGALPAALGSMLLLTTIYLQSVLGLGAAAAGLTIALAPAVSMCFAPLSGRLTDRYGGKHVVIAGFTLFAAGIGIMAASARPDGHFYDLLPGLLVVGLGMGIVFAPPGTIAMQNIDPEMSGAASGLFNTLRLSGSVLGQALVGALVQARFAVSVGAAAGQHAASLSPDQRAGFVATLVNSAGRELDPGSGPEAPLPGISESLRHQVLQEGITAAVRTSYLLPMFLLLAAAAIGLAVRRRPATAATPARADSGRR